MPISRNRCSLCNGGAFTTASTPLPARLLGATPVSLWLSLPHLSPQRHARSGYRLPAL